MKYDMVRVGKNIRALRKEKGMTAKALGEQIGISPSYMALTERGERDMVTEKLFRICETLNVTLDQLIGCELTKDSQSIGIMEESEGSRLNQIITTLKGMGDAQLDFILHMIKAVKSHNDTGWQGSNQQSDTDYD